MANDTDIIESQNDELEVDLDSIEEETPAEEAPKVEKPKLSREEKLAKYKGIVARLEGKDNKTEDKPAPKSNTGELDETQLDYLDLKGITETEDIDVIQKIVSKTGMTIRQALKDDYVTAKLDANRAQRAVKDATPSSTKRGGSQVNDVAAAVAKFDATGELPQDFNLRTAVVNAITDKANGNKPSWH